MGRAATPQEVYDAIFEAGIPASYRWWEAFVPSWGGDEVPDYWVVEVHATEDPDHNPDDTDVFRVSRVGIRKAAQIIAGDPAYHPSLRNECTNLLFDAESLDLDANDADAILQVAVYGRVAFG